MRKYEIPKITIELFSTESSIMDASDDIHFVIPGEDDPPFTGEFN